MEPPITKPKQDWLLPYENPIASRLGDAFFAGLPKTPGVYRMLGAQGQILYVGKAKNLRSRLRSYRTARPHEVSRKVIRMLNLVAEIRWEPCETERAALLRENDWIRRARPPFNVVNKRPESYLFIGLLVAPEGAASFRLTTEPSTVPEGFTVYGAYKGGGMIRRGVLALLRLLWACDHRDETVRFDIPIRLLGHRVPPDYGVGLPADDVERWASHLHRFLRGTSPALLPIVTAALLGNPAIPPFYYRMMRDDLELLREFYDRGPRRHRRLVRYRGQQAKDLAAAPGERIAVAPEERIAQDELDDLLVRYQFRDSPEEGKEK